MLNKKIALVGGIAMIAASITGTLLFARRKAKLSDTYTEIGEWLFRYGAETGLANVSKMSKDELISEKEIGTKYLEKLESINDDYAANVALGVQVVLMFIDAALGDPDEEKKEKEA